MTQAHPAPRPDLLTPIHKGLRRALFDTALALARTDFSVAADVTAAQEAVATCFEYLREHAEHEDRHTVPLVARFDPELAATIEAAHPHLERLAISIDSLWPRLAPLDGPARVAVGSELLRRFQAFVAEQLLHMDLEERRVLALLWQHLSDAELGALGARVTATIPPARMQKWGALLGGALSAPELAAMQARAAA
ncbi:MAG TPA: hemerythrin domain-containing protein [Polyangia bacterium]|nr:hemerythrin domain-containing protein [Polyangia bacterium]